MKKIDLFKVRSMWGNPCFDFACSCARGLSGGILSVWDPNVFVKSNVHCTDNVVIVGGFWVHFSFPCYMVNIYAPQGVREKFDVWRYLSDFKRRNGGNHVFFGDFNVVREVTERTDVPMIGKRFTRIDAIGSKLSKLDRFLVDEVFYGRFDHLQVSVLDRRWYDHYPIFLHVSLVDYGPSLFKFFNSWLELDGFNDMEESRASSNRMVSRLVDIDNIFDDGGSCDDLAQERRAILGDPTSLEKSRSLDSGQKARFKWAIEGDENSTFFHAMLNQRRR
ncbi:hypothetical protein Lser_V15G05028 [Lactuca serriola]